MNNFKGMRIDCQGPNEFLYEFDGNLHMPDKTVPLNVDMLLLRGSSLKNTEWVYGVAVYTGHETKIMKNNTGSKNKKSDVEK
jgi:magnesium-transporting ATPase (P-type)